MIRRLSLTLGALCATGATVLTLCATGAAAAPASTAVAPSNESLVASWYATFLDRPDESAADAGVRYWVDMLDAGRSRQYVLGGILRTDEYSNRTIYGYYTNLLGRNPDTGAHYWSVQTTQHDMAYEWVKQNVLASGEYYDRVAQGSAANYVKALYQVVLGRYAAPGSGELDYWTRRAAQIDRLSLVREIWYTDEAVRHRVDLEYLDILGREADDAGLAYWSGPERASDISTQVEIASTPEYFDGSAAG